MFAGPVLNGDGCGILVFAGAVLRGSGDVIVLLVLVFALRGVDVEFVAPESEGEGRAPAVSDGDEVELEECAVAQATIEQTTSRLRAHLSEYEVSEPESLSIIVQQCPQAKLRG